MDQNGIPTDSLPRRPISLQVAAYLFILAGMRASIDLLVGLPSHHVDLNLNIVYLPAGIGILRLKSHWRICALVMNASVLAIYGWRAVASLFVAPQPIPFILFSHQVGWLPPWVVWPMLAQQVAYLTFTSWVLFLPSVRSLFRLSRVQRHVAAWVRPTPTIAIVLMLAFGYSIGEYAMLSRISDHYPVWTYPTEVRAGGPQYAAGQPWRKVAQWKSKAHESDVVRDDRTYDLTVEGRLRGMVVAARHIELHMMVNDTGSLIEVEMRDLPASVIDPRYGIRSTFRWFSGKSNFIAPVLDHEFALVTLEWDKSDDIVFWPNEYIAAVSSTYHYLPGPCPRISLGGSWVFMRGQFEPFRNKAVPYVDDVRALGVANLDRPSGMFPGESQPVEWRVEIKSRDGVVPPMHFVVPVSSEKPDASSTPTR